MTMRSFASIEQPLSPEAVFRPEPALQRELISLQMGLEPMGVEIEANIGRYLVELTRLTQAPLDRRTRGNQHRQRPRSAVGNGKEGSHRNRDKVADN